MSRPLRWLVEKARDLLRFVDYRLRRRAHIKHAKQDDSNIYPLW